MKNDMEMVSLDSRSLGRAIRRWREAAGLSQSQLASRLGTAQSAVSRWEHGHDEPRLSTLVTILSACGLRAELMVDRDVDRAQIRQQLELSPCERLASSVNVSRLRARAEAGA